jgi:hypothetical protein
VGGEGESGGGPDFPGEGIEKLTREREREGKRGRKKYTH